MSRYFTLVKSPKETNALLAQSENLPDIVFLVKLQFGFQRPQEHEVVI